jgi:hypothetical protein
MGERIGLIAGSGEFPLLALEEAGRRGFGCVVAGVRGQARPELKLKAESFEWIGPAEIDKLLSFLRAHGVTRVLMAGKIDPRTVARAEHFDEALSRMGAGAPDRMPATLLRSLIDFLAREGLEVIDPTFLLEPYFCPPGVLTAAAPGPDVLDDAAFGWGRARRLADEDIGQTLAVKNRTVVAVEGLEGTDEAIKRAGRLAGPGVVVIKTVRSRQDMRIDVPAVGLETVRALVGVRAAALCFEAGRMPFFRRAEATALADANRVVIFTQTAG